MRHFSDLFFFFLWRDSTIFNKNGFLKKKETVFKYSESNLNYKEILIEKPLK